MGKVILSGIVPPLKAPISDTLASDIAVGSSVYLMENGKAVEYLVVHQGLPSSMYDASCDGTRLLRKDCYEERAWDSSGYNDYENSTIHAYLNGDFFNLFGSVEQSAIKEVKIPYRAGRGTSSTVSSGANGLAAKIFLLSGYEVGWTQSTNKHIPADGACLSYFSGAAETDSKRSGYLNGTATDWWLRSPYTYDNRNACVVTTEGSFAQGGCSYSLGIRPALVLPSTALFDKNTLILKGVA